MLSEDYKWGKNHHGNELQVYTSVAARPNNTKLHPGQTLYIPKLDGIRLPGAYGQIFNGCVRVEDECCNCGENEIKFFVGTKKFEDRIIEWTKNVTQVEVKIKDCKVFAHKVRPDLNEFLSE